MLPQIQCSKVEYGIAYEKADSREGKQDIEESEKRATPATCCALHVTTP
jgi:hypothetical protein